MIISEAKPLFSHWSLPWIPPCLYIRSVWSVNQYTRSVYQFSHTQVSPVCCEFEEWIIRRGLQAEGRRLPRICKNEDNVPCPLLLEHMTKGMHAHCKQKSRISKGLMNTVNSFTHSQEPQPSSRTIRRSCPPGLTICSLLLLSLVCCLPVGPEFSKVTRRKGQGFRTKWVLHTELPGWSVGKGSRADHPRVCLKSSGQMNGEQAKLPSLPWFSLYEKWQAVDCNTWAVAFVKFCPLSITPFLYKVEWKNLRNGLPFPSWTLCSVWQVLMKPSIHLWASLLPQRGLK